MFKVIQSHRTEYLLNLLQNAYQKPASEGSDLNRVFEQFVVVVPSMVLGEWLDKTLAQRTGISTLITKTFWGQYQWELMQNVLTAHNAWLASNEPERERLQVPEVAVLSQAVMQWRLFGYFSDVVSTLLAEQGKEAQRGDESAVFAKFTKSHPLYEPLGELLTPIMMDAVKDKQTSARPQQQSAQQTAQQSESSKTPNPTTPAYDRTDLFDVITDTFVHYDANTSLESRLWQLATDLAKMFNRYLTHREDWLMAWSRNQAVDIKALIEQKDELNLQFDAFATPTPEWLTEHYVTLEGAQRHLWHTLFADVFLHRKAIEEQFWHALIYNEGAVRQKLPKVLHIFTIQQLPQVELDFLQMLSRFMEIVLYHYNPSQLYWADIVDKVWLERQQIINPDKVYLREHGHALLSRLGKQSRETFAMLATMTGGDDYTRHDWQGKKLPETLTETIEWEDHFEPAVSQRSTNLHNNAPTILQQLQHDVLMLDDTSTAQKTASEVSKSLFEHLEQKRFAKQRNWQLTDDNSLSIHSCHSLQRQLEVLRLMIGRWLNQKNADGSSRSLSDIVVLLPNVEKHHALIRSVFVAGRGQDGLTLPAKITGVVDVSIRKLWQAIIGFYQLLGVTGARFTAGEVLDWLMLPPLFESFGLSHEQMRRGCDLLVQAGFVRGFDEAHLQQTLDASDTDYRFSFAYALDRLVLGLLMPEAGVSTVLYDTHPQACSNIDPNPHSNPHLNQQASPQSVDEVTRPLANVTLADAPIIDALCQIYAGLHQTRDDYKLRLNAQDWLTRIENDVIHRYFAPVDQTRQMRAIYSAMNGFKASLRANRHYDVAGGDIASGDVANGGMSNGSGDATASELIDAHKQQVQNKLGRIEDLPLKLPFMLESIEATLESQQVSAEPTGVITFGRFGALRNVPFGLVVMLNMNLSEFPNRDRDSRMDLMQAGLARRGDRFSEDDDNGAFLDALLCARSACWIFYNGRSLTDAHEHLPANPVSELVEFLSDNVDWQLSSHADDANSEESDASKIQAQLPLLVKRWLVTEHPPLPFADELFWTMAKDDSKTKAPQASDNELGVELHRLLDAVKTARKTHLPPAKLWQNVYHLMHRDDNKNEQVADWLNSSTKPTIELPSREHYVQLAQVLNGCTTEKIASAQPQDLEPESDPKLSQEPRQEQTLGQMSAGHLQHWQHWENWEHWQNSVHQQLMTQPIDVERLFQQVSHPAKAFLQANQVRLVHGEQDAASQEALSLDHLTRYKLITQLLAQKLPENQTQTSSALGFSGLSHMPHLQDWLPAGVGRLTTLAQLQFELQQAATAFSQTLQDLGVQGLDNSFLSSSSPSNPSPTGQHTDAGHTNEDVSDDEPINKINAKINNKINAKTNDWTRLITPTTEQSAWLILPEILDLAKPSDIIPDQDSNRDSVKNTNNNSNNNTDTSGNMRIRIKANVPVKHPDEAADVSLKHDLWIHLLPNSAQPKQLLKFWLSHLAWQVIRGQSQTAIEQSNACDVGDATHAKGGNTSPQAGTSIWRYAKAGSGTKDITPLKNAQTFRLNPIPADVASRELYKWACFAHASKQHPLALLPKYALLYVYKQQQAAQQKVSKKGASKKEGNNQSPAKSSDYRSTYRPTRTEFKSWLYPTYGLDQVYDTCVQHPIWQYVFENLGKEQHHDNKNHSALKNANNSSKNSSKKATAKTMKADAEQDTSTLPQDEFEALTHALETLAVPLYGMMLEHLQAI